MVPNVDLKATKLERASRRGKLRFSTAHPTTDQFRKAAAMAAALLLTALPTTLPPRSEASLFAEGSQYESEDTVRFRACLNSYTDALVRPSVRSKSGARSGLFNFTRHGAILKAKWNTRLQHLESHTNSAEAPLKVIGAGFGTTATSSLAAALSDFKLTVFHSRTGLLGAGKSVPQSPQGYPLDPNAHRAPVLAAYPDTEAHCHAQLDAFNYTLPTGVDAWLDNPTADIFVDLLLANPQAVVVLTTRPAADWIAERKLYSMMRLPVQRPCGDARVKDLQISDAALEQLMNSYHELVRCMVVPSRLLEIDVFSGARGDDPVAGPDTAMQRLGSLLGLDPPSGQYPNAQAGDLMDLGNSFRFSLLTGKKNEFAKRLMSRGRPQDEY